jgi:hypothetical protein
MLLSSFLPGMVTLAVFTEHFCVTSVPCAQTLRAQKLKGTLSYDNPCYLLIQNICHPLNRLKAETLHVNIHLRKVQFYLLPSIWKKLRIHPMGRDPIENAEEDIWNKIEEVTGGWSTLHNKHRCGGSLLISDDGALLYVIFSFGLRLASDLQNYNLRRFGSLILLPSSERRGDKRTKLICLAQ